MSVQRDCPSCAFGSHEHHDQAWGITPGLIGGQSCGCMGDCKKRWDAQSAETGRWFDEMTGGEA